MKYKHKFFYFFCLRQPDTGKWIWDRLIKKADIAKYSFEPSVTVILNPGIRVGNVMEQWGFSVADVAREAKLISSVDAFFPLLASAKEETCWTNKCCDL